MDQPVSTRSGNNTSSSQFMAHCVKALKEKKLVLPTIPDISLKIRRAISDPKANNNRIAKVVQMDPVITARLIQISNSPLYRGRRRIESCPEALTRLGLKVAQHLITSFAMKTVFKAKTRFIKKRMDDLWHHSSYVAAISAVLAHKTPGFDPDRAMLAGLVHDIGAVPVLTFADAHIDLITEPRDLDRTISRLRGPVGAAIMKHWHFPDDFKEVVLNAEDWLRNPSPQPDYVDIVIVSQLHSFVSTPQIHKYPRIDEIPAYHKLMAGHLDTDTSMGILETAREEIWQIQQMLTR
ncbi:MAG: histidine kinase [Methylothermaceae bacteria B42]|nr:MAG: histidine kinase [Methylothermaceae bacteria B42]HHJ39999.1 HDOD domain-containing protein [Methylothermaceae bacterium]